nr:unnamed protein product [Callosobruchus chinensis]
MGWGAISFGYPTSKSKSIKCARLDVIPTKKCSKIHRGLPETILCTNSKRGAGCGADVGGPLVCNNILYGVASYSGKCSKSIPGVYARIDTYLAFIQPHIIKEADSNIRNQAILVIVLACVYIALLF